MLRATNPSPYMYLLRLESATGRPSTSSAPARRRWSPSSTAWRPPHPIAGTRWRGATEEEDVALEKDLRTDEKERAEHVMLVDLGRNDLGRVCEPGTVKVRSFFSVERYSHVMHLVSTVTGTLRRDRNAFDAVTARFPAGTLSGAPKPRAMEIIEELEPTRRGLYGGIVGYLDFAGDADTAIAIRTALVRDGVAYVQAGGGIVADSDPVAEDDGDAEQGAAVLRRWRRPRPCARPGGARQLTRPPAGAGGRGRGPASRAAAGRAGALRRAAGVAARAGSSVGGAGGCRSRRPVGAALVVPPVPPVALVAGGGGGRPAVTRRRRRLAAGGLRSPRARCRRASAASWPPPAAAPSRSARRRAARGCASVRPSAPLRRRWLASSALGLPIVGAPPRPHWRAARCRRRPASPARGRRRGRGRGGPPRRPRRPPRRRPGTPLTPGRATRPCRRPADLRRPRWEPAADEPAARSRSRARREDATTTPSPTTTGHGTAAAWTAVSIIAGAAVLIASPS